MKFTSSTFLVPPVCLHVIIFQGRFWQVQILSLWLCSPRWKTWLHLIHVLQGHCEKEIIYAKHLTESVISKLGFFFFLMSSVSYFPVAGTKHPKFQNLKEVSFIWLTVVEDSDHGWWAPSQKQHGGRAWQRRAAYPMAARKQRQDTPFQVMLPTKVHSTFSYEW